MSTQEHIQKSPQTQTNVEIPEFAVQSKTTAANPPPPPSGNLKTQLSRATRFGHNLTQMPALQAKAAPGRANLPIQRQAEEEPEQMKSEQSSIQRQPAPAPTSSSSGNSIPSAIRAKMETSFGTSFGDVKIHTGSTQAKSIGALAYTQGTNIHFAPGQYKPDTPSGQSLLGHELTHVVQQRAGRVRVPSQSKGLPINADPALEKEADDMGAKAARGEKV
ncbi:MAG: DUF4157 domain-containing protein [Phormidium sp.]